MEATLSSERIIGKQVIDANGRIVGTVKDIALDLKSREFSLKVATKNGVEVSIQVEDIAASGDVLLLKKPVVMQEASAPAAAPVPTAEPLPTPQAAAPLPQAQPTGLCPACRYQNDPSSRFCIKCGTKLRP